MHNQKIDRLWSHHLRQYNRPWSRPNLDTYSSSDPLSKIKNFFNGLPPPVRNIMFANFGVFLLFQIMPRFAFSNFTVKPGDISHGRIYTPLTSIFGHFSFIHIGFNMLMLYFYGPMVLTYLSYRQFYMLYLSAGTIGSLMALPTMYSNGATLGASGSVFGLMSFVTMKAPNSSILLYGVLPMKLWQLMALVVLVESLLLSRKLRERAEGGFYRNTGGTGISHEAHLTGIAIGFLYYYGVVSGTL